MHWIYAHLIGDYLFQNDKLSKLKKESSFWCFIHVVLYMLPFLFCGLSNLQLIAIAIQHYLIDRGNFVNEFMDFKGSWVGENPRPIWSIILMDNILHILWIAFVVWLGTFE